LAADLGSAYLQIVPSMRGFGSTISNELSGGAAAGAGAKFGGVFSGGFAKAIGPLAGIAVAGVGISKLTGFIGDSISAVGQWQALNAQSASVVKATGAAANVTATQVHNLATSLEGQTSTQAESIQSGANMLLTFKNIRNEAGKGNDVFNQSTKTLVDMSRAMGTDPQQAAIQLGKALNDPVKGISALTRVGVTFDAQQKASIKAMVDSGNTMGAQKVILAELNSEFGGSGAAYRATFPGQVYQMRDAIGDFGEAIATAALPALSLLVGALTKVVNWATQSGVIERTATMIGSSFTTARTAVTGFFTSFASGGGGQVAGFFRDMAAALGPLIPAIVSAVTAFSPLRIAFTALAPVIPVITLALTQLGSALGQGLAAAVTAIAPGVVALTNGLVALLVPLLRTPALVQAVAAGFLIWKAATAGFAFASLITGLVTSTVQLGVNAAAWVRNAAAQAASKVQTVAIMAMYAGEFVAGLVRSGVALAAQAAAWVASTAAMVAARVAMVAGTVAQWALNAAMSANPIGLVVVAIAALVAGLIWFFTQTKLGQAIWAGFIAWLVAAWNTLVAVASTVWNAIVTAVSTAWNMVVTVIRTVVTNVLNFLRTWGPAILAVIAPVIGIPLLIASHWNQIVAIAQRIWAAVVSIVTGFINRVRAVITAVVGVIVALWNGYWARVGATIRTIAGVIVAVVSGFINRVRAVITAVVGGVVAFWSSRWNLVVNFLKAAWNRIVAAVSEGVGKAIEFVKSLPGKAVAVLSGLGRTLFNSGKALINGFIDGIKSMIGSVGKVASDVVGTVAKFFPHSPAKEGPLSGKGYTTYSGKALALDFAGGMSSGIRPVAVAASGLTSAAQLTGATRTIAAGTAAPIAADAGAGFPGKVTLVDKNGSLLGHMDARIDRYDLSQQLAGAR
jgi:phage-related protein